MRIYIARLRTVRGVPRPYRYDLPRNTAFLAARDKRMPQLVQVMRRHKPLEGLRQRVGAHGAQRVEIERRQPPRQHGRDRNEAPPFPESLADLRAHDGEKALLDPRPGKLAPPDPRVKKRPKSQASSTCQRQNHRGFRFNLL